MNRNQPAPSGTLGAVKINGQRDPDRDFWIEIRRALLIALKAVESRLGTTNGK